MAAIDEFNIAQFQKIPEAINRIGAAKVSIAQDAFYRQQALEDERRIRAARLVDAEQMFNVTQLAKEKASDKEFRKKLEAEAASLGIDTKGSNEELLRQIRVKIKAEKDDDKREEREEKLSLLEEEIYARADAAVFQTQQAVKIAQEAQRAKFERDRPMLEGIFSNLAADEEASDAELNRLAAPVEVPPEMTAAMAARDPSIAPLIAGLSPKQLQIFLSGNTKEILESFWTDKPKRAIQMALQNAEAAIKAEAEKRNDKLFLDRENQQKQRRTDVLGFLARDYGSAVFALEKKAEKKNPKLSREQQAGLPNPFQGPPAPNSVLPAQPSAALPPGYFRGVLPMAADYAMRAPSALMASPVGTELKSVGDAFAYPFQTAGTALMGGQFKAPPFLGPLSSTPFPGYNPFAVQQFAPPMPPPPQLTIEQFMRGQQNVNPFQVR